MLDTIIRGGTVIDGTGAAGRRADVGIAGGRIVEIGSVEDGAARVIDATDLVVCPGFVDVHTHLDAQAFWDSTLSPSPLHGVTTALAGNCGFSIAPLTPEAGAYLAPMLARVEGMPLEALRQGVPWDWTTTAEYLDRLDGTLSINTGFLVGHSALRRVVMGPAAVERTPTGAELEAMQALLRAGLGAGAVGFSSSWGTAHNDADGVPVPSRHARAEELVALAGVCREFPGTSLEFIPSGYEFTDEEHTLVTAMSVAAQRPLNWNVIVADAENLERHLRNLAVSDTARAAGGKVVALAMPIDFVGRFCFLTPFILDSLPGWAATMALPVPERRAALRDPEHRRELDERAQTSVTFKHVAAWGDKVISETFTEATRRYEGRTVADIARDEGKAPFDALLDIVCADELRTGFTRVPKAPTRADWEARVRVWRDGRTVIGGSDAGAHLDFMATFYYTTYFLGTVVRREGLLPLEEAVHMLTGAPAALYGLGDRGVLRPGHVADVVVLDPATVDHEPLRTRFDLPGGAGRLYAGSVGIERVLVAGADAVVDGALTEARPGRVLRSGRDTVTPALA